MVKMNKDILNVVCTVIAYARYKSAESIMLGKGDWYHDTEEYYKNLSLPDGMKHNIDDFERIMIIKNSKDYFDELRDAEENELDKFIWKR